MTNPNLFFGNSSKAQFANIIYRCLMGRKWFTYADVMAESEGLSSANDLSYSITKCRGYIQLKKAFNELRNEIEKKEGKECIETRGNNRSNKSFRYVGIDPDPLSDMRNVKIINDLRQYWRFCQDSAGFFPTAWLEYFFKDCKDLFAMKKKLQDGEQVLTSSMDRILKNIQLLPSLYEDIIQQWVLSIAYKPYEEQEPLQLIFHPQHLREYNGRWHLFGHAEGLEPEWTFDVALDRIEGVPKILHHVAYLPAPKNFYSDYFNNKVGVSHHEGHEAKDIVIRAHTSYMYKLTETKPIHGSQKTLSTFAEHADGCYGDFCVHVEVNNELIGKILQMGDGLEVVSPQDVRDIMAQRIANMNRRYVSDKQQ